jgi:hypothetical protein
VSLQGSLDTFALPDVLVLLASTKKTGELAVSGVRSAGEISVEGRLWFADGALAGHEVGRAPDAATALFELLRLDEGAFAFDAGSVPDGANGTDIEPVLARAQSYLVEWRDIERAVPSLRAGLVLNEDVPAESVELRADQWRLVAMIGGGCDVNTVIDRLGAGELAGCRAVKDLVEAGLVAITDPPLAAAPTVPAEPELDLPDLIVRAPEPSGPAVVDDDGDAAESGEESPRTIADYDALVELPTKVKPSAPASAARATKDDDGGTRRTLGSVLRDRRAAADVAAPASPDHPAGRGGRPATEALARQLAALGEEDGEAPVAPAGEDDDEAPDRGLLLKFLSSVRD